MKFIADLRQRGGDHFRRGQYDHAIREYQKGINFTSSWPKNLPHNPQEIRLLHNVFYTNLAQCYIMKEQFDVALEILELIKPQTRATVPLSHRLVVH
jgi:tetratricopeptide (TPR) repeat protein